MAIINNRDVLQSYILTTAKYDFSVYEKRIIYQLVDMAQSEIEGLKFRNDCRKIEHDLFGLTTITMPITSILANENDKNHALAKEALVKLSQKYFIYEDIEVWEKINIVVLPKIQKNKSSFTFILDPKIWDCILNFSKGYRKLELMTAMQFESIYSMRFYELMSGQKHPLSYSINELKEMFQIQDKYKQINDFIKRVIEPAKKELDEKSPYSFEYKINKKGRAYHSITFFPVKQNKFRDEDLETKDLKKKTSISWVLDKNTKDYLKNAFGFTTAEIKQNISLFDDANKRIDLIAFMAKIKPKANRANNPKGYLINAIKKELQQKGKKY